MDGWIKMKWMESSQSKIQEVENKQEEHKYEYAQYQVISILYIKWGPITYFLR